ncbi:MAG: TetR/AcrR family transcriptional regulator, partial [Gammaproteobacteria bacterium]
MTNAQQPLGPGRAIRQNRSRKTYEAFISTGFKLIEKDEFETITIARLAESAGYSVGAFYARFESRDEFLEAMVAHHLVERDLARRQILQTASHEALVETLVADLVHYYWRRRRFWRAVLMRSSSDVEFWKPINHNGKQFVTLLTERIEADAGRPLTESEAANIGFATHIVLGMINNRIVNRPRPSLIGHTTFVDNLARAFRLVADYDNLSAGHT